MIAGLVLYTLTIWTILGNIFILIAINTNKQLKQNGNSSVLIGNLAFSDLLLGVTVLPFSATFSTFKVWPFGQLVCDIWLSIDVLCCTASIWGLLMIALDRYIATNHPIKYRAHKNNPKIAIAYISTAWLISVFISLWPLIFEKSDSNRFKESGLKKIEGTHDYTCVLFHKPLFVVLSSIGSFYLPLFIMIILYSKVFIRIRRLNKFRSSFRPAISKLITESAQMIDAKEFDLSLGKECINPTCFMNLNLFHEFKEAKITKILVIIMTSFVLCWFPFFTVSLIFFSKSFEEIAQRSNAYLKQKQSNPEFKIFNIVLRLEYSHFDFIRRFNSL